jgi:hypothetical protein
LPPVDGVSLINKKKKEISFVWWMNTFYL